MKKPLLLVVTGMPASGKTTLAHLLAKETLCPLISRDELKEGYTNTLGIPHHQMDKSVAMHIYESFFEVAGLLLSKGISVIIEAAFQHKLWKPKLSDLSARAEIKIIICTTSSELAKSRFKDRLKNDPEREKYHGDSSLYSTKKQNKKQEKYEPVKMSFPVLEVDTSDDYSPGLKEIIRFIRQKQ